MLGDNTAAPESPQQQSSQPLGIQRRVAALQAQQRISQHVSQLNISQQAFARMHALLPSNQPCVRPKRRREGYACTQMPHDAAKKHAEVLNMDLQRKRALLALQVCRWCLPAL